MKRKIIKQKDSYTITLPIKWVKQLGLTQGSELEISEVGKEIIISAEKEQEYKTIDINVKDKISGFVWREILGLYRKGYDEFVINHEKQLSLLREIANYLIGFEVVNQEKNKVVIKDVTGLENADFDTIFRRIGFILIDLTQEMYRMLQSKINKKEILLLDRNLNKFTDYCLRYLNKKGLKSFEDIPFYSFLVSQLEHIGDVYKQAVFSNPNKNELFLFENLNKIIKQFVNIINIKNINKDKRKIQIFDLYFDLKKFEKNIKKETPTTSYLKVVTMLIKDSLNLLF